MTRPRVTTVLLLLVGSVLLAVFSIAVDQHLRAWTPARDPGGSAVAPLLAGTGLDGPEASIDAVEQRLERVPADWQARARLGMAHIEQARVTADPSHYARAEQALRTSLDQRPEGNDLAATGMGALANARHDFTDAATWAQRALRINPHNATAYGVLADARIQLGQYERATRAVQQMLDIRPDLPALTRASYELELQGRFDDATALMQRALEQAHSGAARAWVHTQLSHLAFSTGDLDAARRHADRGLHLAPGDFGLTAALARVLAAQDREQEAIARWEEVVEARPLPEYLLEYGAYLSSLGRSDAAADQFEVFAVVQQLFAANGVSDDLSLALYEADFGDPAAAVVHARAELDRRANIDAEDAMAWALHRAGRDDLALAHARRATNRGTNPIMLYHRGMIEKALGMTDDATRHLSAALERNPHFSPLHAPLATAALAELRGETG